MEKECRVCRLGETEEEPLYSPCLCRGSIQYLHQQCLSNWIQHRNITKCEVCQFEFQFESVFAEGAPTNPGFGELCSFLAGKTMNNSLRAIRILFVLSCWLLLLPLLVSSVYRTFTVALDDLSLRTWLVIFQGSSFFDLWLGICLCLLITLSSVLLFLLREYLQNEEQLQRAIDQALAAEAEVCVCVCIIRSCMPYVCVCPSECVCIVCVCEGGIEGSHIDRYTRLYAFMHYYVYVHICMCIYAGVCTRIALRRMLFVTPAHVCMTSPGRRCACGHGGGGGGCEQCGGLGPARSPGGGTGHPSRGECANTGHGSPSPAHWGTPPSPDACHQHRCRHPPS